MNNKFIQTIVSTDKALKKRAEAMATEAEIEMTAMVNEYKRRKAKLELKLASLTDLSPDSTTSLNPRSKDWNPKSWVTELQNVKLELADVKLALETAEATYKEFFSEIKEA